MDWFWLLTKHQMQSRMQAVYERLQKLEKRLNEVTDLLTERLVKLERIERIATNVARERAQRPKNWSQFRTLAEGVEEPNANRRQG